MAHHGDFQAELADRVAELVDGLLGRVHRDDRGGRDAIGEIAELVRDIHVEGAAHRAAHLVVLDPRRDQSRARIENREIEAELIETLVEQPRDDSGRAIERVLRRLHPETLGGDAEVGPFRGHHPDRRADAMVRRDERVGDARSGDASQVVDDRGAELDVVAVGIDHRMTQACADLLRSWMGGHRRNPL
jgi:hypothetical protein